MTKKKDTPEALRPRLDGTNLDSDAPALEVFDPAMGSGGFLKDALRTLREREGEPQPPEAEEGSDG